MAYATCDDVVRRYSPLLGLLGTSSLQVTTVDIASIYIADAESIVNLYLGSKYVIPLTPEPALTDLTSDIAIYRVLADKAPRIPDFMNARYTNATSMLAMIRDGAMFLSSSSQQVSSGGDEFAWSQDIEFGRGPIFRRLNGCDGPYADDLHMGNTFGGVNSCL